MNTNEKSKNYGAILSSLLMGITVAIGAFASHALKDSLGTYEIDLIKTATLYSFIHCLSALLLSYQQNRSKLKTSSMISLIAGSILFPGALYSIAFLGDKSFGFFAPFGGGLFMLGWIFLVIDEVKR